MFGIFKRNPKKKMRKEYDAPAATQLKRLGLNTGISSIAGGGIGAYKMQTSAPNSAWSAIGVINNTSLASGTNTAITLWRHTDDSKTAAPTTYRTLKNDL